MTRRWLLLSTSLFLALNFGFAQNSSPDSAQTMPRLEIPEITIVGKKAITLPFARKGEIYDMNIYQAPPPDSSLLGERLSTAMPTGAMPRDEEKLIPFHASAEGNFGSFSTGALKGFLDYSRAGWKFFGNAGFASTQGHVDYADASSFELNAGARTLFSTDNDVLKTLQLFLKTNLVTDKYGMFAFQDTDRARQNFSLFASLNSLDRRGITVDLGIGTKFWTVTDKLPNGEFEASSIAPTLTSSFAMNLGKTRWRTALTFNSISLDYSFPTQSVTLFTIESSARWRLSPKWNADLGIVLADGSDIQGASKTLIMPTVALDWNMNEMQAFTIWWRPSMQLQSYDSWTRFNPYLALEFTLQPERTSINLGVNYSLKESLYTVGASLSFSQSTNKAITLADSGRLRLDFVEATQTKFELDGSFLPTTFYRIHFSGTIQPTYESGSSEQLVMTPLILFNGTFEYDFPKPVTARVGVDFASNQNIDRMAARTIDGRFLLNIGASTTIIPRSLLSASIKNLLGVSYDWWERYPASGLQFLLEAKVNLR